MTASNVESVANMIAKIRFLKSLPNNSPTDAELLLLLNSAWAELHGIMLRHNPDYFVSSSTISVVSGTSDYDLPSDFYKSIGVIATINGNNIRIPEIRTQELLEEQAINRSSSKYNTYFSIVGEYIRFTPTPTWSDDVTFYYNQCATQLESDDTAVKTRNGYDKFLVRWVVSELADRDGMGENQALQRLKSTLDEIKEDSANRNKAGTKNKLLKKTTNIIY